MSDDRTFERNARSWLELGPADAPDRVIEDALFIIDSTSQERDLGIPWRFAHMNRTARLIGAAAALVVVVLGGIALLGRPASNVAAPPTPTPAPSSTIGPSQSAAGKLVPFTSPIYGYTIEYPAEWVVRPAARPLSGLELPLDTSPGVDTLALPIDRYGASPSGPHGTIFVSSAQIASGTTLASWTTGQVGAVCGAPPAPEPIKVDGEAGILLTYTTCNGNLFTSLWVTAFHGTSGFYVLFSNDPGTEAADRALFERILATFTFAKGVPASPTPS